MHGGMGGRVWGCVLLAYYLRMCAYDWFARSGKEGWWSMSALRVEFQGGCLVVVSDVFVCTDGVSALSMCRSLVFSSCCFVPLCLCVLYQDVRSSLCVFCASCLVLVVVHMRCV